MYDFTEEQIQRYSRHILLQDVGVEGQENILNAKVLVVGAGGLGAPVSFILRQQVLVVSALLMPMWSTSPTYNAKSFILPRTWEYLK